MSHAHDSTSTHVLPLRAWRDADRDRLGGKAMGLVLLRECDCPVPDAFGVTTDAFRAHLARAVPDGDVDALASVRARIEATPIAPDLERAIDAALHALPEGPLAVRSSSPTEDGRAAAFAGLHDTLLNVTDRAACLAAIRACWASVFSDRAAAYRAKRSMDATGDATVPAMAVIVQALVPAHVAGIAFSSDPVGGARDRVVIESSWGLGASIVAGRVTPDRFVVRKRDGAIVESTIGAKQVECVPASAGGTIERPVEAERAERPSLDEDDVRRLAERVAAIERHAGAAQDVEFAHTDAGFAFLQARPVTTTPLRRDVVEVWSNLNTAEVLPDVVAPITWSAIGALDDTFRAKLRRLGIDVGDAPLIGLVAGRAYFNVTTLAAIGRRIPFGRLADVDRVLGGAGDRLPDGCLDALPPVRVRRWRLLASMPGQLVSLVRHHPRGATRRIEAMAAWRESIESRDLRACAPGALVETFEAVLASLFGDEDLLLGPAVGMMYFLALGWIARTRLGDEGGAIANGLLAAQGGLASAESGLDLWRLATWTREHPAVADVVRAPGAFDERHGPLAATDDGAAFLRRWERFLAEHGHHTRGEIELLNPRWRERPDYVLDLLRHYLDAAREIDPLAAREALARESAALADRSRARLFPPWRPVFDTVVRRARAGAVVRENLKNEAIRHVALLRRILLELGTRLRDAGVLDDRDDVFFLDRADLARAVRDGAELRAMVAGRRAVHERHVAAAPPPPIVVGHLDGSRDLMAASATSDTTVLRGIAVSPGRVIGPARVILRATDDDHVRPGEILVAPFTDPGWTPYFVTAAGIVMDVGGLLSHGSIVAREYGIPAVVNVGAATTRITTGRMIEVDGGRGEVRLLDVTDPA